jgi:dTDP-4-dehydrorhamnose reductase
MRLLVFGGWGQLGTDLAAAAWERGHDLARPRHAEVDVTDRAGVAGALAGASPDVVMNLAAFHQVERCEGDPGIAFEVNAVGALIVARAAAAAGARHVYLSTDYVFDGLTLDGYGEDAATGPLNVYGVSKVAGEHLVRNACPDSLVVRGSGLFGRAGSSGKGGNFVETMLAKAARDEDISVVDDQVFSPTSTRDMAERLLRLLEAAAPADVYHLANAGSTSWFGFARAIFEISGLQPRLTPRTADPTDVRRPARSVLLDTRTAALGLPPARPWTEALSDYLTAGRGPSSREPPDSDGRMPRTDVR